MKIRHAWSAERAVGFVVGVAVSFFFTVAVAADRPEAVLIGLAFLAAGILVPARSTEGT